MKYNKIKRRNEKIKDTTTLLTILLLSIFGWINMLNNLIPVKADNSINNTDESKIILQSDVVNIMMNDAKEKREKQLEEEENKRIEKISIPFSPYTKIDSVSELTKDEIYNILRGTSIQKYYSTIYDVEQNYNINAYIIIGTMALESGYCESEYSYQRNNLFGLKNHQGTDYRYFDTKEDSIWFYGKLIRNFYIDELNKTTLKSIQPIYCPPDSQWDDKICAIICEKQSNL